MLIALCRRSFFRRFIEIMPLKCVDFLKFFFCLCIVVIHCDSLSEINPDVKYFITQGLLRLAVPFFFVTSGYFLGKKIKEHPPKIDEVFKKYVKRLLVPLVVFSLINIILEIIKMIPYMSGPVIFREIIRHVVFYPWGLFGLCRLVLWEHYCCILLLKGIILWEHCLLLRYCIRGP